MSVRLRAHLPEQDLDLRLSPGAAIDLDALGGVVDLDVTVAWLAGRRGPWRPGALRVDGRRLGHRRTAARVRAGLVPIGPPRLAAEVSVRDHLAVVASLVAVDRLLATVPTLRGRGRDRAGVLSGGERQMVAWARAALVSPRVVVLDRAATGLDPDALAWATGRLRTWREDGCVAVVRAGRGEESAWPAVTRPDGRVPGPHGPGPHPDGGR